MEFELHYDITGEAETGMGKPVDRFQCVTQELCKGGMGKMIDMMIRRLPVVQGGRAYRVA